MMNAPITIIVSLAMMAVLGEGTAFADNYPIAPAGTSVALHPSDFMQAVPVQSQGLPNPNPVVGDNLSQHPGAFGIGHPPAGTFFIGVFGGLIDTSNPHAAVYLWETTGSPLCHSPGSCDEPFRGPRVQLGFWNGMDFIPHGVPNNAFYRGTGVVEIPALNLPWNSGLEYEIASSITPLSDFGLPMGYGRTGEAVTLARRPADEGH